MDTRADTNASKKAVLLVSALASFLSPFMNSAVAIALPTIAKEFTMDAILLSWIPTSSLLVTAMLLVPFGRLADIYGRKKIFIYGMLIYTVATLLSANATSAIMLIFFRILQGLGNAMTFGTSLAILTSVFPRNEMGKALGIRVAAVYFGLTVGPFFGGILTQQFGWRSIFYASVPLCLIIIAVVLWKLKGEWAGARGERFDLIGSIIYGAAIIAVMYGISLLPAISAVGPIAAGILGIWAFVRWEMKVESPILDMSLIMKNKTFAFSNLAALIYYWSTFAVTFLLSLYLQFTRGLSPQSAGLFLMSMPAMQTILSPVAGRLSDRIAPRILAAAGMALTTVGLVLFHFLTQNTTVEFVLVGLVIIGSGFAFFSSPNTNAIMSSVENRFYGIASAMVATMRQVGMMFSMGIIMLMFAIYIGRTEITPEYYPAFVKSMQTGFAIFAFLCFTGIFASLARGKMQ